jgi:hypothetical protein
VQLSFDSKKFSNASRSCLVAFALLCAVPCWSQSIEPAATREECDRRFGVRIGNEGKDVIWVPTHDALVTAMLAAAQTTPQDYVIDLGAGDGKIPIASAKQFGARALGIEYDAAMVQLARCYIEAAGVADKVEIRQADIFQTDLSEADVVTLYLLPKLNRRLRPRLLALDPGTRIVSNRFKLGSWQPDRDIVVEGVMNQAYLWIVPERVAGLWHFSEISGSRAFRLRITQRFQRISATMAGSMRRVRGAKLQGRHIEFVMSVAGRELHLSGEVDQGQMRLRDEHGVAYVGRRL